MTTRIGHRGAAGTAPENTLASMRRALAIGVDAVEFDIHRTGDGELIVMHDFTVDRTSNGTGTISALTAAEIARLDAGAWKGEAFAGEAVPTLEALVAAVPAPTILFLELKAGSYRYPGIEEELVAFLKEHDLVSRTQVSSFDHVALLKLRELLPELPTGMLYSERPVDPVAMARACGATALHPNYAVLPKDHVAAAHAAGLQVNVWTPNTQEAIDYCYCMGVDGIITDYPERLRRP
ncbi:MAG TPA: glycerophosphodiester phosphodiesterase family protein [Symbiobacteriaceae bacterium]|nr:glycerophosphodiester phosphodiesterase family protein [Symbiobacteriaceae bacterium]